MDEHEGWFNGRTFPLYHVSCISMISNCVRGFNLEDSQRCDQKDGFALLTGVASVCLKEERLQCLDKTGMRRSEETFAASLCTTT